jgi:hypothetical protein
MKIDSDTKAILETNLGKLSLIVRSLEFYKENYRKDDWIMKLGNSIPIQVKIKIEIQEIIDELKKEIEETNKLIHENQS